MSTIPQKRKSRHSDTESQHADRPSPFLPMFETFRAKLDEHQDRRERIVKASRDITAASKKIIFGLQRVHTLNQPLHASIVKATQPHLDTVASTFKAVAPDLQGLNAYRYSRSISGGVQEFVEALTFRHYLETQRLMRVGEVSGTMRGFVAVGQKVDQNGKDVSMKSTNGDERTPENDKSNSSQINGKHSMEIQCTPDDYIGGLFDLTGELMRFAVTSMATSGALPATSSSTPNQRTILHDLQDLRAHLETLDGDFRYDKKIEVCRASVQKVERALYGLIVRGSERPKGWMPEEREVGEVH